MISMCLAVRAAPLSQGSGATGESQQIRRGTVSRGITAVAAEPQQQGIEHRAESIESRAQETTVAQRNVAPPTQQTAARTAVARVAAPAQTAQPGVARSAVASRAATDGRGTTPTAAAARAAFHENDKGITNADPSLRRAGISLRPTVAEVGGRAVIAGSGGVMTGSNVGDSRARIAARSAIAPMTVSELSDRFAQASDLNAACFQQFSDCMDQFCAVLDTNQGRCSCSDRITSYARVEAAVRDANNELNDVAQRIRYIGLTAEEIRAIMSATEAEMALTGSSRDVSANRHMLDQIEALIRSPSTSPHVVTDSSRMDLQIDFNFDGSNPIDMFTSNNPFVAGAAGSFAGQRGEQLFNSARRRCEHIITSCRASGADITQVVARYEMEVDRDCIEFERGLNRMNETLRSNVRAANQMLQRARLAVLQNHNQFDIRGCVGALESCMLDGMVCGRDYVKCMDPTKRFIDDSGRIVLGQDIAHIRGMISGFNAANFSLTNLPQCNINDPAADGGCVIRYLLEKMGTGESPTSGLCRAVMDRCRSVTHTPDGRFNPQNEVIRGFISRAMINIRSGQEKLIADHAMTCMQDISACYNQQVSHLSNWAQGAGTDAVLNIMRGACRNVALTCAYAVFADNRTPIGCPRDGVNAVNICINNISELFFQNMLCPPNSTFQSEGTTQANVINRTVWVNTMCKCNVGLENIDGTCRVSNCPLGAVPNGTTGAGQQNSAGYGCACRMRLAWNALEECCPAGSGWSSSSGGHGGAHRAWSHCKCDNKVHGWDGDSCAPCPDGSNPEGRGGALSHRDGCKCDDEDKIWINGACRCLEGSVMVDGACTPCPGPGSGSGQSGTTGTGALLPPPRSGCRCPVFNWGWLGNVVGSPIGSCQACPPPTVTQGSNLGDGSSPAGTGGLPHGCRCPHGQGWLGSLNDGTGGTFACRDCKLPVNGRCWNHNDCPGTQICCRNNTRGCGRCVTSNLDCAADEVIGDPGGQQQGD